MEWYTDQLGRRLELPGPPLRILSLVPSITELLAALRLDEQVVGITRFCVRPPAWRKRKTLVGGTKQLDLRTIAALRPDLILANKEENRREDVEELMKRFPVWVSDVCDLPGALEMIRSVGALTGREGRSAALCRALASRFGALRQAVSGAPALRAAYFIWRKPWMLAGGGTYIDAMMREAGMVNIFGALPRYPELPAADLPLEKGDCLLLSSEPFPFRERHAAELRARFPGLPVLFVDGQLFSWYGSRLMHAPAYFRLLRERMTQLLAAGDNP